ncbi:hypothetical protein F4811DRAFT_568875 [Daldinia bambusicola]|nr:hypothetical protein F4811DRAFT_568875 [Daldinia bambusicola]
MHLPCYSLAYSNIASLTGHYQLMAYLLKSTTMAAVVTADELLSDLERGQGQPKSTRGVSCVRYISHKVLPFFIMFLVVFSAGGILAATLSYNKPLPREPVIVISAMILAFLVLCIIGLLYLYLLKRFPPLTPGPNAPDRPAPVSRSWKDRVKRCCELIIEKLSDNDSANEPEANPNLDPPPPPSAPPPPPPGTSDNPVELDRSEDRETRRRENIGQPYYGPRNNSAPIRGINWLPQRRPVASGFTYNPSQVDGSFPTPGNRATMSPTRAKPNGPRDPRPHSRASVLESLREEHQGGTRIHWASVADSADQHVLAGVFGGLYILAQLPTLAACDLVATEPAKRSPRHNDDDEATAPGKTQARIPSLLKPTPHPYPYPYPETGEKAQKPGTGNGTPRTVDGMRRHIAKLSTVLLQLLDEACLKEQEQQEQQQQEEEEPPRGRRGRSTSASDRSRRASVDISGGKGKDFYPLDYHHHHQRQSRRTSTTEDSGSGSDGGRSVSAPPSTAGSVITVSTLGSDC